MYKRRKTKNGLETIVSPMSHMASVSVGLWIGVGGRYEKPRESGLSHLIEHMVFKGTHRKSAGELKQSIEGVGGSFNGFTSDEVTCYMIKVPAKHLEKGIDILTDMVFNSRFDADDIAREKFVVCEEIKMYRDQPAEHVQDVLNSIMWPGNPLGRALTGTISTVKSFKRDRILAFRDAHYHPANMAIVAAGKVDPARFFRHVSKNMGKFRKRKRSAFTSPPMSQKTPRLRVQKGDTSQTHIAMGFPALDGSMRERFALKMMNVIFGGNMSSRLFEELREKYGLCYDVSSSYKRHRDVGEITVHAGVDNRKAAHATIAVLDEIRKLRDIGVTEDELARAKEYAKGQFLLSMERTSTRMLWLGDRLMVHNRIPEVGEIIKSIDRVTASGIKKMCERIFRSTSVNLAMIGDISDKDRTRIRKELTRL